MQPSKTPRHVVTISPRRCAGQYFSCSLVFENDAVHLAAELRGKPPVLNDGDLQSVTGKRRVEVSVYGATHSFQHDEISLLLFHPLTEIIINVPVTCYTAVSEGQSI